MPTQIRPVASNDHAQWLAMWDGYLAFYQQELKPETTATTWKGLLSPGGHDCLVAVDAESLKLIGFVTYLFHASTWTDRGYCYLEDLYVTQQRRGSGAGTSLINAVVGVARHRKVSRVYWHTGETNDVANSLYQKVAKQQDMIQFRVATQS